MSYRCTYLSPTLDAWGVLDEPRLALTTERHKITLSPPPLVPLTTSALDVCREGQGIVLEMSLGLAEGSQIALASKALSRSQRVWFYWPKERVVEVVDPERVRSWRRHWRFVTFGQVLLPAWRAWYAAVHRVLSLPSRLRQWARAKVPTHLLRARRNRNIVNSLIDRVAPVPFPLEALPTADRRIPGTGVYLRTDFWSKITSGGSYGHTSYVVKELAASTEDFVCFMAHPFPLIDSFGIKQVDLGEAGDSGGSENAIVEATRHYYPILKEHCEQIRPTYIYERLALGSYVGAALSCELKIPYLVEYNGSEISMRRSFDKGGYLYENVYLLAEEFAFRQATFISVVSEEVKKTLIARGIPESKILVNPNGADLDAYQPGTAGEKRDVRRSVGLAEDACVVGFSGTFGGWHGVDVLAEAIPRICEANANVVFLLIGDGNFKHQVDAAVEAHKLGRRVISVGRVPQTDGARLLKACDLYVSPHSSHMVDSRFFGSPTKVFEYMAMAGGVVASDLEQIGVVLSPALRVADLRTSDVAVTNQRSVLCKPGDVDDFVEAVTLLSRRLDLARCLGHNARQAVADHYSWRQHVAHLWTFLGTRGDIWGPRQRRGISLRNKWSDLLLHPNPTRTPALKRELPAAVVDTRQPSVVTGDAYKDEVQRQWDNDPAGSHYVKNARKHSLQWFLEAETYRYGEYAPWMAEVMEFAGHRGSRVLEIGGGMGTDLAQFAKHGALVTDVDLSSGHLNLAEENLGLRGLTGTFVLHDAETLPFEDNTFDVVYSNGVIHHTPNTRSAVCEMRRVLRPGGRVIVMVYAENSLHYWRNLVWALGVKEQELVNRSMGEIMSYAVERSDNAAARPLVKVYTKARLRQLFDGFAEIEILQRQMVRDEVPRLLARVPVAELGKIMGWNLIIKARKPVA